MQVTRLIIGSQRRYTEYWYAQNLEKAARI